MGDHDILQSLRLYNLHRLPLYEFETLILHGLVLTVKYILVDSHFVKVPFLHRLLLYFTYWIIGSHFTKVPSSHRFPFYTCSPFTQVPTLHRFTLHRYLCSVLQNPIFTNCLHPSLSALYIYCTVVVAYCVLFIFVYST